MSEIIIASLFTIIGGCLQYFVIDPGFFIVGSIIGFIVGILLITVTSVGGTSGVFDLGDLGDFGSD